MDNEKKEQNSWLDKPLASILPTITIETLLVTAIILVAIISRFYHLDLRVMSHDEVNHVVPSWDMSEGRVYRHDPVTHGPLQFHLMALSYFLFGDNDFTARLPHALFGIAGVVFILFAMRRYIGRKGALIAGFLALISPYMLFYGRYARNDIIIVFFLALMFFAVWRYLETGKPINLFLLTGALVFQFVTKEVAYIHAAQLLIFLAVLYFFDLLKAGWKDRSSRDRFLLLVGLILLFVLMALASAVWMSTLKGSVPSVPVSAESDVAEQASPQGTLLPKALLIGFAAAAVVAFILALRILVKDLGWKTIRASRSFDMLILTGSLILPLLSAFPVRFAGWNPLDYTTTGLLRTGLFVVIMVILSVLTGLWWDWRKWLWHAALFWGVFIVFYTSFFTNGQGFFTGLVGSLGYWLEQQKVNRGSQPFYYYALIQIPVYEYLPALGSLLAIILGIRKRLFSSNPEANQGDGQEITPVNVNVEPTSNTSHSSGSIPVLALLIYWAVTALLAYSYAGEKMPQMTLYVALPMILATGWVVGYVLERIDWKKLLERRGLLILVLLPVFFAAFSGLLGSLVATPPPFQGNTLDELRATNQFFFSILATALSGGGIVWFMRQWSAKQVFSLAGIVGFFLLSLLTLRTAYTASYINYDTAKEYLVYAHAARGPKDILEQVEEISRRTTGGLDVKVAYDSDGLYPFWWYFRDYPNHRWYGDNPTRDLRDYPLIIASEALFTKIEPVVQNNYVMFEYMRLWWPNQDYYNLSFERIWNAIKDPQMRAAVFDIWLNRDYDRYAAATNNTTLTLETWQPSNRIRLYIRKDIIAEMWNYGSAPAISNEITVDPYDTNIVQLLPDAVIGQSGANPGEFSSPREIAVAPDDTIYVADQLNHRVQHFDAEGNLLHVWGTYGNVLDNTAQPGTFNEPWGIAVGPDGSVYVADTWNYRIQKFTADGQFLTMWGYSGQGEAPDAFYGPRGLAVDTKGNVYVADTGNKRIVVFSSEGEFVTQFGSAGMELGQLEEPVAVALDENNNVYVTDTWNQRVQVFAPTPDGQFFPVLTWEINGWFSQSIDNKPFIAVDPIGKYVFVTDPEGYRVLQFDLSGNFVRGWGDYSPDISGFGLPIGIAIDQEGRVWVSDSLNARLMRFDLAGLPPPVENVPAEGDLPQENLSGQ